MKKKKRYIKEIKYTEKIYDRVLAHAEWKHVQLMLQAKARHQMDVLLGNQE